MEKVKNEVAIATIVEVNPINLTEFSTFRASQLELVKENPLVIIEDTKSYDAAKKSRTALKTGRTALQSQDKEIAKKLAAFRKACSGAKDELIEITLVAEQKQQVEIDSWEEKKAKLKAEEEEKERIAFEKLEGERDQILVIGDDLINLMTFKTLKETKAKFDSWSEEIPIEMFNDPALGMNIKFSSIDDRMERRIMELNKEEDERVRLVELAEKEKIQKAAQVKLEKERKAIVKLKADAKKLEQENKRKAALLDCKLLRADQRELLSEQGYIEDPKDVWKLGGSMISTAIFNEEIMPVLGFVTLEELAEAVELAAKECRDREAAALKVKESEAAKTEAAQKKIDDITAEVKIDELKKPVDIPAALETKDIEVIEPYTFPTDLGIDNDLEVLNNRIGFIREKVDVILTLGHNWNTDEVENIQANLHDDLFKTIKVYADQIKALQEAKTIAE